MSYVSAHFCCPFPVQVNTHSVLCFETLNLFYFIFNMQPPRCHHQYIKLQFGIRTTDVTTPVSHTLTVRAIMDVETEILNYVLVTGKIRFILISFVIFFFQFLKNTVMYQYIIFFGFDYMNVLAVVDVEPTRYQNQRTILQADLATLRFSDELI